MIMITSLIKSSFCTAITLSLYCDYTFLALHLYCTALLLRCAYKFHYILTLALLALLLHYFYVALIT
jgi:hypothetical protein